MDRSGLGDDMMTKASHDDLARRLRAAYDGGAVPPLRDGLDPTDADGAYAVQTINTRFWEAQGRRIVGRKAGLTATAVQVQLGVDQPDVGVLFEDIRVADGGAPDPARSEERRGGKGGSITLRSW